MVCPEGCIQPKESRKFIFETSIGEFMKIAGSFGPEYDDVLDALFLSQVKKHPDKAINNNHLLTNLFFILNEFA